MAKAKYVNTSRMNDSMDINMQQNVEITENELIDPDLLLRSFGISDDFVDHMADLYNPSESNKAPSTPGVIMKNSQRESADIASSSIASSSSQGSQNTIQLTNLQSIISTPQSFPFTSQPATSPKMSNPFNSAPFNTDPFNSAPSNSNMFLESTGMPVTLEQRNNQQQQYDQQQQHDQQQQNSETHVTLPLETLQQLLSQNISFGSTENLVSTFCIAVQKRLVFPFLNNLKTPLLSRP